MIGIVGGTGLENFMKGFREKVIKTDCGAVFLLVKDNIAFINRHGKDKKIPPHLINHKANLSALKKLKVNSLLGVCSVGSLKKEIPPGSILIPDDYINFHPLTFFDSRTHITPELDSQLREKIIRTARKLGMKVISKGIYFQSCGPRLETRAEVKMLRNFSDVVGMTLASEATLAKELGIRYAGICQVDNYAHGLAKEKLDFQKIMEKAKETRGELIKLLGELVKVI